MNFEEIKKKYPKAWDLYIKCLIKTIPSERCCTKCDMFKFFDEQGIYIDIYPVIVIDKKGSKTMFQPAIREIYNDDTIFKNTNTRQGAEQAAFTKAFEILENK